MSAKQLSRHGHDQNDEDCDMPTDKHEDSENDVEPDTPSTKQRQNSGMNEIDEITIKESKSQKTGSEIIGMLDTYDRPADANAKGIYAGHGSYASSYENKPGKRIPKAGYSAEAGIGKARAEYSIFEAEARGPNAGVKAEVSAVKFGGIARAEIAGASAKAGPVAVKVGLGFDTGASIGLDGVELKFLGTGFTVGPKMSVSALGSEASVSCSVM
ncbi:uncharacterized protein LOC120484904 [Pimephales promelas]|uniref:uncharacterized protein LOC120484904 n=1 Tax=Pimephales promelas TaxID=90988 RepID=UPI0019558C06|nr:uncharacterized protein LOC120484904 [Pimephales promelas]KAG1926109.1 hypothetical protein F2P79_025078 [Pimephales promelas]